MTLEINEDALRHSYLVELRQAEDIAEASGVSRRTIERRLKKLGISRSISSESFPEAPLRRLYIEDGEPLERIALIYRVNLAKLAQRIQMLSIPLREKHMDGAWLRDAYKNKGRTTCDIADELGISNKVVSDWLSRHGIATARSSKPYQDRDWLSDQYERQGKSIRQIARELSVSYGPIQQWLHIHEIPVRGKTYSGYKHLENAKYRDPDWLRRKRYVERKSEAEIARECNTSRATVNRWMRRFELDGRGLSEATALRHARNAAPYKDRDWLVDRYKTHEMSTYAIAAELGVTPGTVLRWMRRLGIELRSPDASYYLSHRNYLVVDQYLKEMLEGELLGDGSVVPSGLRTACYGHGTKHRQYVVWLAEEFAKHGLMQSGAIRRTVNHLGGEHTSITYVYRSRSYAELMEFRLRFYPQGKKIVPEDLVLTPIVVRQWYIGDGQIHGPPRQRASITLHTCAFDADSIATLLKGLSGSSLKVTHQPAHNAIHISAHSTREFLNYIGPCPEPIRDVYGYKWDMGQSN